MGRFGGSEDLDQFRDERARQGSAGDDGSEFPPEGSVAEAGNHQVGDDVGEEDGDDGGDPDQRGQGRLEVHFVGVLVFGAGDGGIEEVGAGAGEQHADAHDEDPYQQFGLGGGALDGQQDEGDQGHAGDAVGFEAVGAGADRVAGVVTGAVCDDTRVARIVFLDLEDDLHEVGADVGDLGEDAAGDTEGGGTERFADGEADEAGAGVVARDEQEDGEHDQQFDRDQQHADAHSGLQRNRHDGVRFAAQSGEGCAGVGEGVDANSEPRHAVAAGDADEAENAE